MKALWYYIFQHNQYKYTVIIECVIQYYRNITSPESTKVRFTKIYGVQKLDDAHELDKESREPVKRRLEEGLAMTGSPCFCCTKTSTERSQCSTF